MYRNTSNSSYGQHYSQVRGYSVNPRSSTIINQKPVGLQNLTNTCYISAILQILFLILPDSMNRSQGKVTQMFFKLKSTKDTRDYKMFKIQIEKVIEIVRGFEQQDAQEFLIYFLQALNKQNSDVYKKSPVNLDYNERANIVQNYKIFMSQMKKLESSPIIQLFSSQLLRQFRCQKNHLKHKFQRYQCLSLSFPTPQSNTTFLYSSSQSEITLKQLIQKQLEEQLIEGLICEQCKRPTRFKKSTYLYTLPNYLIMHLARFKQGYYSNQKINTIVEFDQQISFKQSCDNSTVKYRLQGTVNHFGTLNRGHYFAQVRHIDENWYQINDEVVRPATLDRTNRSKYVYILFYKKIK